MKKYTIWFYWFVTAVSLAMGLMLWPELLYVSMLVVLLHGVHFYKISPYVFSFPMQVRLVYLGLLVLGQLPYCSWIHWVQLVGTTVLLSLDYCPLARMLSLMPWNRSRLLSWKFLRAAIVSRPVNGSIIEYVSPEMVTRLHPENK